MQYLLAKVTAARYCSFGEKDILGRNVDLNLIFRGGAVDVTLLIISHS